MHIASSCLSRDEEDIVSNLRGKRIIIVQQGLEMGGSERQGLLLARYLKEVAGAEVEFWGLRLPGSAATVCDRFGIPWRVVGCDWTKPRRHRAANTIRLALALRRAKPDAILPYTMPSNVLCGSVWRLTGARVCLWNQRDEGLQRFPPLWERWAVWQTPQFISNSEHAAGFLAGTLRVPSQRISVIRNGVQLDPPEADRESWRARMMLSKGTFAACMVASLSDYKDHTTLIHAWKLVVDGWTRGSEQPALLLAGVDYGMRSGLENLVVELGVSRSVHFLGGVSDVTGLLNASDLGVFSSRREGCPNAVLEAMGAGLAVAATDIAGIREAVGDEGAGYLAAPSDAEGLAQRILRLARDPVERAHVAAANKKRVETMFSPEGMVHQMTDILTRYVH